MTRFAIFIFLSLISNNIFSQHLWFRDFQSAQTFAVEEGKLILIDFWASWCKPCRDMELHLWDTEEFAAISENFITLKIDIDQDKETAMSYNVKSIPKVVIINAAGELILEQTGFSNAKSYLNILGELPNDVRKLNDVLEPEIRKDKDMESSYKIALAYQELGRESNHYLIKDAFFDKSNEYLRKVKGESKLEGLSELHQILNIAYRGRTKQVYKKLQKMEGVYSDPEQIELFNFIQAYCYKVDGDTENLLIKKELIENKTYLDLLDS